MTTLPPAHLDPAHEAEADEPWALSSAFTRPRARTTPSRLKAELRTGAVLGTWDRLAALLGLRGFAFLLLCAGLLAPAGSAWGQAPANDGFANRTALGGASLSITNHNLGSSIEVGEPNHAGGAPNHSVWWVWRAPTNGPVVVGTVESDFDTAIAIYTRSMLTNLTAIASNADAGARRAVFEAMEGVDYVIAIAGKNGASGNFRLTLGQNTPDPEVQLSATQPDKLTVSLPRQAFQLGWHFESSTDLVNWSPLSDPAVLTDTEASLTMDTTAGNRFFRPSNQIVYTGGGGGGGGIIWIWHWIWLP